MRLHRPADPLNLEPVISPLRRQLSSAEEVALTGRRERRAWRSYATTCRNADRWEYETVEAKAWRVLCVELAKLGKAPPLARD